MEHKSFVYRFLFYFLIIFSCAVGVYYLIILLTIFSEDFILFRSPWGRYPHTYPISYITIPCFFYSVLAALFHKFSVQSVKKATFSYITIVIITTVLSSMVGGILWHLHDMMAGYFPRDWLNVLLTTAISRGLRFGWGMLFLSIIPYNLIGIIISYKFTVRAESVHEFLKSKLTVGKN